MITAMQTVDDLSQAIRRALTPQQWLTALEVMTRCPGRRYQTVRDRLFEMAADGDIEKRRGHRVREYRAWK